MKEDNGIVFKKCVKTKSPTNLISCEFFFEINDKISFSKQIFKSNNEFRIAQR